MACICTSRGWGVRHGFQCCHATCYPVNYQLSNFPLPDHSLELAEMQKKKHSSHPPAILLFSFASCCCILCYLCCIAFCFMHRIFLLHFISITTPYRSLLVPAKVSYRTFLLPLSPTHTVLLHSCSTVLPPLSAGGQRPSPSPAVIPLPRTRLDHTALMQAQ